VGAYTVGLVDRRRGSSSFGINRPVRGAHVGEALFFVASPGSWKARNLVRDAQRMVSQALQDAHLVVEGTAAQVTSPSTVDAVARDNATNTTGTSRLSRT